MLACIGDAKRETLSVGNQPNLGPGCYEVEKPQESKPSYAPFSSMQPKFSDGKTPKKDSVQVGPGTPSADTGSYEIAKNLGAPCFTKIENERSIIIKIHDFGSSVFRSDKPRFRETQEQTPGPGQCSRRG